MPDSIFVWTLDSVGAVIFVGLLILFVGLALLEHVILMLRRKWRRLWDKEPPK